MLDELSTLSDYIRAMRTHYKPQMNGERYYTTEEVCQMLKITKRTLQQYRDDGVIPFVALPGKMLYRESDLRAALEKNYVAPFAHFREYRGARVGCDIVRNGKCAVGTRPFGVHTPFGNYLTVEMG